MLIFSYIGSKCFARLFRRKAMMKKGSVLLIAVMSISILLIGCSIGKKDMKEDFGFEKAQRIEVLSEGNPSLVLKKIDN